MAAPPVEATWCVAQASMSSWQLNFISQQPHTEDYLCQELQASMTEECHHARGKCYELRMWVLQTLPAPQRDLQKMPAFPNDGYIYTTEHVSIFRTER